MAEKSSRAPVRTLVNVLVLLAFFLAVRWFLVSRIGTDIQVNAQLGQTAAFIVLSALCALLLALARFWRIRLYLLPVFTSSKDRVLYILSACFTVFVLLLSPIRTRDFSIAAVVGLLYTGVIIPAFEEFLFRGYLWARLRKSFKPEVTVCMLTALLFAVWRAGYGDAWLFERGFAALDFTMAVITNAVLGLMIGLFTGFARLFSKNCVPGLLLHIMLAAVLQ